MLVCNILKCLLMVWVYTQHTAEIGCFLCVFQLKSVILCYKKLVVPAQRRHDLNVFTYVGL